MGGEDDESGRRPSGKRTGRGCAMAVFGLMLLPIGLLAWLVLDRGGNVPGSAGELFGPELTAFMKSGRPISSGHRIFAGAERVCLLVANREPPSAAAGCPTPSADAVGLVGAGGCEIRTVGDLEIAGPACRRVADGFRLRIGIDGDRQVLDFARPD